MDKKIQKLIDKYGSYSDVELGEIPMLSDDMTDTEKKLVEKYIAKLIDGLPTSN